MLSLEKAFLCGGLRVKHSFETRGEREREIEKRRNNKKRKKLQKHSGGFHTEK